MRSKNLMVAVLFFTLAAFSHAKNEEIYIAAEVGESYSQNLRNLFKKSAEAEYPHGWCELKTSLDWTQTYKGDCGLRFKALPIHLGEHEFEVDFTGPYGTKTYTIKIKILPKNLPSYQVIAEYGKIVNLNLEKKSGFKGIYKQWNTGVKDFHLRSYGIYLGNMVGPYFKNLIEVKTEDNTELFWLVLKVRDIVPPFIFSDDGHCAMDALGVLCWAGGAAVPELRNPRKLFTGHLFVCALDDEGTKCWGENKQLALEISKIKNLTNLWSTYRYYCTMSDSGFGCKEVHPKPYFSLLSSPDYDPFFASSPELVSLYDDTMCVIENAEVKCQSLADLKHFNQYPFLNPISVTASYSRIAVIDDLGMYCFKGSKTKEIKFENKPRSLKSYDLTSCALDGDKLKCCSTWEHIAKGHEKVAEDLHLKNLKDHWMFSGSQCFLDDSGLRCVEGTGLDHFLPFMPRLASK